MCAWEGDANTRRLWPGYRTEQYYFCLNICTVVLRSGLSTKKVSILGFAKGSKERLLHRIIYRWP